MKVTNDKYELPIAVADSPDELAEMLGLSISGMKTAFAPSHLRTRKVYKKVLLIKDASEASNTLTSNVSQRNKVILAQ